LRGGLVLCGGDPGALFHGGLGSGDLCILGCVACWAAYTLAGRAVMARVSPLSAVTWSCLLGGAFLFPPAFFGGLAADMARAGPADWLHLLFFGIMATGYGFFWYYEGIKTIGASRAGVYINLVPVVAVLLGFWPWGRPWARPLFLAGPWSWPECGWPNAGGLDFPPRRSHHEKSPRKPLHEPPGDLMTPTRKKSWPPLPALRPWP
jgi:drug/metabolite transporter (DMT)-like permease